MAVNLISGSDTTINQTNDDIQIDFSSTRSQQISDLSNNVNTLMSNRLTKLWENQNPASAFSSQTITLSSDNYDYLIWFYGFYWGNLFQKSSISLKSKKISLDFSRDYGVTGTYYSGNFWRNAETSDYLNFQITDCFIKYGNNTGDLTNNAYLIPIAVYGGKF